MTKLHWILTLSIVGIGYGWYNCNSQLVISQNNLDNAQDSIFKLNAQVALIQSNLDQCNFKYEEQYSYGVKCYASYQQALKKTKSCLSVNRTIVNNINEQDRINKIINEAYQIGNHDWNLRF